MNKKEEFKSFLKSKPELINYIKNENNSVQKLYEVYDVYGDDKEVWDKYLNERSFDLHNISNVVKNIDMDSIKNHINTAQKALNIVQELTSKSSLKSAENVSKLTAPKPINKFFGD